MADNNTTLTEDPTFTELRAALGVKSNAVDETGEPLSETKVEEPKAEEPVEETTPEPQVDEKIPEPQVEDKKPKRFSELTRRAQAAEEKATQLAAELAAERAAKVAKSEPEPVKVTPLEGKPVKPNAETFSGSWQELEAAREKYTEDLAAWSVQNALHQQELTRTQKAQSERAQAVHQTWQQQYDASVESNERTEAAVKAVGAVVGKLGITDVVKESEVGVEIVLALDADPTALDKLSKMSIASAAREIGRIEASILAKKAAPATQAKKLPEPPANVGGSASGASGDQKKPEDMDLSELRRYVKSNSSGRAGLSVRKGSV